LQSREDYLRGQNTFAPVETQLQTSPSSMQFFGQTPQAVIAPAPGAVGPDMRAPVNGHMSPVNGHAPQNGFAVPQVMSSPQMIPHSVAPHPVDYPPVPQMLSSPMMLQNHERHGIQPIVVPAQLSHSPDVPRSPSGSLLTYTDQFGVQQQVEVPQQLAGTPPQHVVLIPSPRQERRTRTPDRRKDTAKSTRSEQLNKEQGHHRRTSSFEHVTQRSRDRKMGSSGELSPRIAHTPDPLSTPVSNNTN
jgi:hypothetical protein